MKISRRTKPQNLRLCGVELQALRSAPRTDVRAALFDDLWNVGRNATTEELACLEQIIYVLGVFDKAFWAKDRPLRYAKRQRQAM